jgi:hypothetical protein
MSTHINHISHMLTVECVENTLSTHLGAAVPAESSISR